mmetsp:Transcript_10142/g.22835  ORF Transcript_10142/g.22835 Transcript_10142/m.22835 type:complete len:233 (-) Transcript_10142:877-1575(-)
MPDVEGPWDCLFGPGAPAACNSSALGEGRQQEHPACCCQSPSRAPTSKRQCINIVAAEEEGGGESAQQDKFGRFGWKQQRGLCSAVRDVAADCEQALELRNHSHSSELSGLRHQLGWSEDDLLPFEVQGLESVSLEGATPWFAGLARHRAHESAEDGGSFDRCGDKKAAELEGGLCEAGCQQNGGVDGAECVGGHQARQPRRGGPRRALTPLHAHCSHECCRSHAERDRRGP